MSASRTAKSKSVTEVVTVESDFSMRERPRIASSDGGELVVGTRERALAEHLNVDLTAPSEDLLIVAVDRCNRALRLIVQAGLSFLALRDRCEAGQFLEQLAAAGVAPRRAQEAMTLARGLAAMPTDQVEQVLALSKSKALAIGGADPEVIDALLADGAAVDMLTVRDLRDRIHELQAELTDTTVERDTAANNLQAAQQQLNRAAHRTDQLPVVVADLRAEIVAHHRRAELAVDAFTGIGTDLAMLIGTADAHGWTDGTARLAMSSLAALRLQIDGQIARWQSLLPKDERFADQPHTCAYLTPQELAETAQSYAQLIAVHQHEKALREWEREQARPRGKGRPRAKPKATQQGAA